VSVTLYWEISGNEIRMMPNRLQSMSSKEFVMIEKIGRLLALRVTSDSRVAGVGSIIIYIGGVVFCVLACRKIVGLNLNEKQHTLGLLLIVCATMLMFVVGMLV
jgi:hypothetical protein